MESQIFTLAGPVLGLLVGLLALLTGVYLAHRNLRRSRAAAAEHVSETRQEAETRKKEILVAAQEQALTQQEDTDRRDKELDDREGALDQRARKLERSVSELDRDRKRLEQKHAAVDQRLAQAQETLDVAEADRQQAKQLLETNAGMDAAQARAELIAQIETQAGKVHEESLYHPAVTFILYDAKVNLKLFGIHEALASLFVMESWTSRRAI